MPARWTTDGPVRFEPLTPAIGAIVHGVDLSQPLDRATAEAVYRGLLDHLVLFFDPQDMPAAQHVELGRLFGRLEPRHPMYAHVDGFEELMIIDNGPHNLPDSEVWHSDLTARTNPPFASILQARMLPPLGGDTMFASMYAAYDALSDRMKSMLEGLTAVHDMRQAFDYLRQRGQDERYEVLGTLKQDNNRTVHPVIAVHPITGRKLLYVNASFTTHIVELSAAESRQVLDMLFELIATPLFHVRWRWKENAIAFWDNRSTQHYGIGDYLPHRRIMHRVTVAEDSFGPELLRTRAA